MVRIPAPEVPNSPKVATVAAAFKREPITVQFRIVQNVAPFAALVEAKRITATPVVATAAAWNVRLRTPAVPGSSPSMVTLSAPWIWITHHGRPWVPQRN